MLWKKGGNPFMVLAPLWLILFCSSVQQVIVAPVLPRIQEALLLGDNAEPMLGLIGASFSFSLMIFALIAGVVSDRIGRRKIIMLGSGALAVTLILHTFATTLTLLLLLRGLSGAAAGLLTGSFAAYIGDYFPYERRGWALGWVLSGFAVGWIIGIPAGSLLADQAGFTAPFVAFGWIMAGAFALVLFFLPQPAAKLDESPLTFRLGAEKYLYLLKQRQPGTIVGCYFLMYSCVGLFIFFLPSWLEQEIALSSGQVATLFSVAGVTQVVASPVAGRLSDHFGRKVMVVAASLCTCAVVGSVTLLVTGMTTAVIFFGLAVTFESFRAPPLQALMSQLVSSKRRGTLFSLCNAVGQCGFGSGTALAGWLYGAGGYVSNSIAGAACMGLVALVIWSIVTDPRPPGTAKNSLRHP